jgi:hypothetical protein
MRPFINCQFAPNQCHFGRQSITAAASRISFFEEPIDFAPLPGAQHIHTEARVTGILIAQSPNIKIFIVPAGKWANRRDANRDAAYRYNEEAKWSHSDSLENVSYRKDFVLEAYFFIVL